MKSMSNAPLASSLLQEGEVLRQIDEILLDNRKVCSTLVMSRDYGTRLTDTILRYVLEDYLELRPEQVRDQLTASMVERFRLWPYIHKRIICPTELDGNRELQYVAWHLYPWTRNAQPFDLIIKVYMEILTKKRRKYPKGFFDDAEGENRAKILLKTMINEYICPESIEELYEIFADDRRATQLLCKYSLRTPLVCIFTSPLEYLHESLGSQANEALYFYHLSRREQPEGEQMEEAMVQ